MPILPGKDAKRSRIAADKEGSSKAARTEEEERSEGKEYVMPPPRRIPEEEEQQQRQQEEQAIPSSLPADNTIWEQKAPVEEAANLEEELDSYFEGMFA